MTADSREVYRYQRDGDHVTFAIRRNFPEKAPLAIVDCDADGSGDTAMLPPHEVPKACRAMYEAAGLDVPDLPDIPDPAEVEQMCNDLRDVRAYVALDAMARELLARGWGRTS